MGGYHCGGGDKLKMAFKINVKLHEIRIWHYEVRHNILKSKVWKSGAGTGNGKCYSYYSFFSDIVRTFGDF